MFSNPQFERDPNANGSLFKFLIFNFFANTRLSLRWRRIRRAAESPCPPPHSSWWHIQRDRAMLVRQDTNSIVKRRYGCFLRKMAALQRGGIVGRWVEVGGVRASPVLAWPPRRGRENSLELTICLIQNAIQEKGYNIQSACGLLTLW
jgi:hypothetical protein